MLNQDYITRILNLEDVIITNVENISSQIHIHLELPRKKHVCPSCGALTDTIHDYRCQVIKDVPLGRETYLHGGIQNLIPAGYGYIMEFYLLNQWRKRGIGANVVSNICNKLKGLGCPKVYLTTIVQSERFWTNTGFNNSGLIDPDNGLPILIKEL